MNYVVYAGSSEGCGCGFRHALLDKPGKWLDVINAENAQEQEEMKSLYNYLIDALNRGSKIELYVCWNGDEADALQNRFVVSVDELIKPDFYLKENSFYKVRS